MFKPIGRPRLRKANQTRAEYGREQRQEYKAQVFQHYGNSCACCGENTKEFLTVDHIDGCTQEERREQGQTKGRFHEWIIKNEYPNTLQILCMNCNFAKGLYGVCPYQFATTR